jgi:DNA-binding response OmpR family regulator
MRVLLVEDDGSIAEPLIDGLARYDIIADRVAAGAAVPAAVPYELVLLGPGLPGINGVEVRRRLSHDLPMIMLIARGAAPGPRPGVDDCLAEPFSVGQLVARIRAVARGVRPAPADDPVRTYGPLRIDTRSRQIRLHGVPIPLAPKEYDLLVLLAAEPGAVLDRRHILETVWEPDFLGPGKTLDFHVASLRRKLGSAGWIENRRGVGFRLVVPA